MMGKCLEVYTLLVASTLEQRGSRVRVHRHLEQHHKAENMAKAQRTESAIG